MLSIVRPRLTDSGREWLDLALTTAHGDDVNRLCASYTAAARKAGTSPLALTSAERARLSDVAPDIIFERWTVADATRAAILLTAAADADADTFASRAIACFDNGDAQEQQSWLRGV